MNDNQLEGRVAHAFEQITPDILDSVLSDCREQKGNVIVINSRSKRSFNRSLAGIVAALVLLLGGAAGAHSYSMAHAPVSVVSLDVNPSIEIKVNRNEKVIEVTPKNEDAVTVVGDMDFAGSSLELTVNALIGSMLKNGYLSDMSNSILISVDSNDAEDAVQLQAQLNDEISVMLQSSGLSGAVLSQVVSSDEELEELADSYGITAGKAQLIRRITENDPRYSFEALAGLSINDLNLIISSAGRPIEDLNITGAASDKNYIGHETAMETALRHAGLTQEAIRRIKAGLDFEDGSMVYDVEFESGEYEYEYGINAATGEIIKSTRELAGILEDAAEKYGETWEAWAEAHADEWEAWAEQYAGDWEAWARDHADQWELWAEQYAGDWENWAKAWEAWAERYFDF